MERLFAPATFLLLAACGGGNQAETTADKLEEAAAQSDPAAAQVLEDAADRLEGADVAAGAPGSPAQDAMQAAGNAQAETVTENTGTRAPNSDVQAKPHAPGDPVPPPKTTSQR